MPPRIQRPKSRLRLAGATTAVVRRGGPEQLISDLASVQHGVVARRQLLDGGLSVGQIRSRLSHGMLMPVHSGVYAVGHLALTSRSRWMAAVLAGGDQAYLSHLSAANLWRIGNFAGPVEILRPANRAPIPRLKTHRTRSLQDHEKTVVDGIPVTSVARTLVDLASVVPAKTLDDCISAARRRRLLNWIEIRAILERAPNRKGTAGLKQSLLIFERSRTITRSELETRFLRLCDEADLPMPEVDVPLGNRVLDFLWRSERVIVEVDGFGFHHHRFNEDRIRDLDHLVAGYRTVRVTYSMIETDRAGLIESLRSILERP
jgi:hypothetical protein